MSDSYKIFVGNVPYGFNPDDFQKMFDSVSDGLGTTSCGCVIVV